MMQKYCDTAFECYIFVSSAVIFSSWKPLFLHLQPSFSEMVQKANCGFVALAVRRPYCGWKRMCGRTQRLCGRAHGFVWPAVTAFNGGHDDIEEWRWHFPSSSSMCIFMFVDVHSRVGGLTAWSRYVSILPSIRRLFMPPSIVPW